MVGLYLSLQQLPKKCQAITQSSGQTPPTSCGGISKILPVISSLEVLQNKLFKIQNVIHFIFLLTLFRLARRYICFTVSCAFQRVTCICQNTRSSAGVD